MTFAFLLATITTLSQPTTAFEESPLSPPYLGSWKASDADETYIHFEKDRCVWKKGGRVLFYRVRYWPEHASLESWARIEKLDLVIEDGSLLLDDGEEETRYAAIPKLPEGILPIPVPVAATREVEFDQMREIQDELRIRMTEDQALRRDPGFHTGDKKILERMLETQVANGLYVQELMADVGWIDADRFGKPAALAAFLLVQHSGDLNLMLGAIEPIEEEVKRGQASGQHFALLYDRLQLSLGYRQRYGSQLGGGADGSVLMSLQDRENVDELRRDIGMGALDDYLALFAEDGQEIRYADDLHEEG